MQPRPPRIAPFRPPGASWRRTADQAGAAVFGVALAAAVLSRGAFFAEDFHRTLVLAAVSLALTWLGGGPRRAPGTVLALVGGSVLISAVLAGSPLAHARPTLGLGIVLAAGVAVGVASHPRRAAVVADAVVVATVIVALSAWYGIAARHGSWAAADAGVWRGASTLTYANAAGVAAAMGLSLAVARRVARGSLAPVVAANFLWVGVACSLSRAAWLAALVGLAVVAVGSGWRRVAATMAPGLVGAWLAMALLLPSMVELRPHRPALAALGLLLGVAVTLWLAARWRPRSALAVAGVLAACSVVVLLVQSSVPSAIVSPRLTAASADRAAEWSAAWDSFAERPVAGSGPGQLLLAWRDDFGRPRFARFAHNEYLELAATQGLVGLGALALAVGLLARELGRGGHTAPGWVRVGAGGALAAFVLASTFDFLWHVPALPMIAAVLVGLLLSRQTEPAR